MQNVKLCMCVYNRHPCVLCSNHFCFPTLYLFTTSFHLHVMNMLIEHISRLLASYIGMHNCHSTLYYCDIYQGLSNGGYKSTVIATSPANKKKNRFANICVCELLHNHYLYFNRVDFQTCADDDNRIVLKPIDQYESDYVNASYVDVSMQPPG